MKITTPAQLGAAIDEQYPTRRAFIEAFNEAGGELEETTLSKQLHGARGLSAGWRSAYALFFKLLKASMK